MLAPVKFLERNSLFFFFFNDTATTEIYTLSLHDALPISPRHLASPEDGAISPAMMRSSVDLPEPERPSRPTISPERMVRSTFSRTNKSSPLPFGNDRQTPRMSRRLVWLT